MKKSFKLMSITLCFAVLISTLFGVSLVASAKTEENKCGQNLTYSFNENTGAVTISGTGAMDDYVSGFSPFFGNENIKSVVIEDGVTSVGDYAFTWCENLQSVYLGKDVATIGSGAFEQNYMFTTGIEYIKLPQSVTTVKKDAFLMCDVLICDYSGTGAQFEAFTKSSTFDSDSNATLANPVYINCADTLQGELVREKGNNYKYMLSDGTFLIDDLCVIDEKLYYFDENALMARGFVTFYGPEGSNFEVTTYFNDNGAMAVKQWVKQNGEWFYLDSLGCRASNVIISFDNYYTYGFDEFGFMLTGWQYLDNPYAQGWYYFYQNGIMAKQAWVQDSAGWLYVDGTGAILRDGIAYSYNSANDEYVPYYLDYNGRLMANTWHRYDDDWMYILDDGSLLRSSWTKDSFGWVYLDDAGFVVRNAIVEDSFGYLYVNNTGHPFSNKQFIDIDGNRRSTDDYGYLQKGWVYFDDSQNGNGYEWIYFDSEGMTVTEQIVSDSHGYLYMNSYGLIERDAIIEYEGVKYAFDSNGYMVYGWYLSNGEWYYFNSDGSLRTNAWAADSYGWLFMDFDGKPTRNDWSMDYNYYLGSDGYMLTGWLYDDVQGKWLCFGSDGRLLTDSWAQDSRGWCFVNDNGYMVVDDWIYRYGECYYVDSTGHMVTGMYRVNGRLYKFEGDGRLVY